MHTGGRTISLSPRDARVLKLIQSHETKFGCGPSLGDLRKAMGFKSKTSAENIIISLQRRGLLRRSGPALPHARVRSIQTTGRAAL